MDLVALSSRLARRWWLLAGLAALAALGAATASAGGSDEHRTKLELVLRPDASVTNDDLPGTLEALKSDGTLMPTVVGVLRNRALLRRAAADADVTLSPAYTLDVSAQPGSTLIDATLSGPDRTVLDRLVAGYSREASIYVAASYPAYVLEHLSTEAVSGEGSPSTGQIVIVALLLGAALGVVLVAAELRLEPQLQRLSAVRRARAPEPKPEPEPRPEPERKPEPKLKREPKPKREPKSKRAPEPSWRDKANGGPERAAPSIPPPRPAFRPKPAGWRPVPNAEEDDD